MNWLRRNWLYILAFALPFERIPSAEVALAGHSVTLKPSFVIALVVALVAAWQVVRSRRLKLTQPDIWLVVYGVVMAASAVTALDRGRSLTVIVATSLVVVMAMVIERTLPQFNLKIVYQVLVGVAMLMGLIGLYQYIADSFGAPEALTALKHIYTKAIFGFPRIQATSLEPLYLASFLLLPVSLLVSRIYARPTSWKPYAILTFLTMIIALTLSRGGIYASLAVFAFVIVALRSLGTWRRLAGMIGSVLAGAGLAIGLIYVTTHVTSAPTNAVSRYLNQTTHLSSSAGSADSDRTVNRRLALEAFKSHPVFGIGIGNFGAYAYDHDPSYTLTNNHTAIVNNEYYEVLAETGIAGLLALLGFAATVMWQLRRLWAQSLSEGRVWLVGLTGFLLGMCIQYYSFSTLYIDHLWFGLGLLMGLLAHPEFTIHLGRAKPSQAGPDQS